MPSPVTLVCHRPYRSPPSLLFFSEYRGPLPPSVIRSDEHVFMIASARRLPDRVARRRPGPPACSCSWLRSSSTGRRRALDRRSYYTGAMASAAHQQPAQAGASSGRVLSIQSHVVSGYVGNKCAVLPLQLLGFDVDPLHTVQFSNHTGFPRFTGQVFDGEQLTSLVDGMEANGLLQHSHMLTGYIGSLSLLEAVVGAVARLRAACPGLTWVCDPVMGDEGRLYVAPELVAAFSSKAVPLASVLTPNQFEAELLTGRSIAGVQGAVEAAEQLMAQGPHTVVITSMGSGGGGAAGGSAPLPLEQQPQPPPHPSAEAETAAAAEAAAAGPGVIVLVACTRQPQQAGAPSRFTISVPKIDAYFTGTGDLLAALLLAYMELHPGHLARAVEAAVAALQGVLHATAAAAGRQHLGGGHVRTAAASKARELRLVQNLRHITHPEIRSRAVPL